jgi:hypothetical protein
MTNRLAIVTITADDPAGFAKTMESVRQQNAPKSQYDWYVINGSRKSDQTKNLLDENAAMVAWSRSENDNGIYHAMNKGLEQAVSDKMDWVIFMNGGDCFHDENVVASFLSVVDADPKVDFVFGDWLWQNQLNKPLPLSQKDMMMPARHQSMFFKMEAVGDQRHNEKYKIVSDLDFYLDYKPKIQKPTYMPKIISNCEAGGVSDTNFLRTFSEIFQVRQQHGDDFINGLSWLVVAFMSKSLKNISPTLHGFVRNSYRMLKRSPEIHHAQIAETLAPTVTLS